MPLTRGRIAHARYVSSILALLFPIAVWVALGGYIGTHAGAHTPPEASDVGVLTTYQLADNRGPWQLKWDASRNLIWFSEGNHSDPVFDGIGSIDPATNILKEWRVPTEGAGVHGNFIDRNNDLWFTETRSNKVGRFQPDTNTITEWSLSFEPYSLVHSVVVDDIVSGTITVWFSERDQNVIGSLNPATNQYRRHRHPFPNAWPHSITLAPDHSLWFVETCGNRVGRLVPGPTETWTFWQPPTPPATCAPPNGIGPLFGLFVNGDFWYSEPYNGNIIRLRPAQNNMTIWRVPGSGGGSKQITQVGGDPDGDIFFTEMNTNRLGRLEPAGATTPTVVTVVPTVVTQPAPPEGIAVPASVVYTPIVTELIPTQRVITGTRTGGIVEWVLPRATTTPGRYTGPGRAWYGGGGFWASLLTADQVVRFAPYTQVPSTGTASATPTSTVTTTITASATATSQPTFTQAPPTDTPVPTNTPCAIAFTDVQPTDYFYRAVRYLYCAGAVTGYGDDTFRPYNSATRGQLCKIVALAEGWPINTKGGPHFTDVSEGNPFYAFIETAYNRGIIRGYSDGAFRPGNDVTRGQLCKIVALAEEWPPINPPVPTFNDVPFGSVYYAYIETAYCHGIIGGYGDGTFRPVNSATRGHISKIVYEALAGGRLCP